MKKQKTWENLEVNDLIQDSDGDRKTILAIVGRLIFISSYDNQDEAGNMYTKEDLIKWGYTIVQDKEEEVNKEENLKKLIEETKYFFNEMLDTEIELKYREIRDLLAKWKGVEVEKIKYIK